MERPDGGEEEGRSLQLHFIPELTFLSAQEATGQMELRSERKPAIMEAA